MDPDTCLDCAERALSLGDLEEAREALGDYASWRARGGFSAKGCDARFHKLFLAFGGIWIAQSAHRTGGGKHRDRREKRLGGRKLVRELAVRESGE